MGNVESSECPHCGSENIVVGRLVNQLFCQDCGSAFEEFLDELSDEG